MGVSSLVGRWTKRIVVLALLFGIVLGGAVTTGVIEQPSVVGVDNRIVGVNENRTVVDSSVAVKNPNPIGVRLGDVTVNHTVSMNGIEMGEGSKEGIELSGGTSTIPIRTRVRNDRIPGWWASHIENGERTTASTDVTIEQSLPVVGTVSANETRTRTFSTDLLSSFDSTRTRNVSADVPLLSDPLVRIENRSASWGRVTNETTGLEMAIGVSNPQSFALPIANLEYTVSMNGIELANGSTDPETVPAKGSKTIDATATIENDRLDEWWVTHLENDQESTLSIRFAVVLDLPNDRTIRIPLEGLAYNETVETDIFDGNSR